MHRQLKKKKIDNIAPYKYYKCSYDTFISIKSILSVVLHLCDYKPL